MGIFVIVLYSATLALNETFTISLRNRRRKEAQQDISAALDQITRELRQAKTVTYPLTSSAIDTLASSTKILEFTDSNGHDITYGVGTPTDSAEVIAPVIPGVRNYQLTVQWGAGATAQALTEQNITAFTAERPTWSSNVVIITIQSTQMDAVGSKASPLCVTSMVTLRQ